MVGVREAAAAVVDSAVVWEAEVARVAMVGLRVTETLEAALVAAVARVAPRSNRYIDGCSSW
jgi:hypothetical protein